MDRVGSSYEYLKRLSRFARRFFYDNKVGKLADVWSIGSLSLKWLDESLIENWLDEVYFKKERG